MKQYQGTLFFVLASLALALASWFPYGRACLLYGLLSVILIALGVKKSKHHMRDLLIFGLCFHLVAIYWLPQTLTFFGGFPFWVSLILFVVFAVASSLQFVLVGFLFKPLDRGVLKDLELAFPLAWFACDYFIPRLFPWTIAHSQISWKSFSGLGEFVGVYPLTFIFLWWGAVLVALGETMLRRRQLAAKTLPILFVLSFSILILGNLRTEEVASELESAPKVKLGIIQGNLAAKEKGNIKLLEANLGKYRELSNKAASEGAEILIWPESVSLTWVDAEAENLEGKNAKGHPFRDTPLPLLYGGLTYKGPTREEFFVLRKAAPVEVSDEKLYEEHASFYNTALGIDTEGTILGRYHKRVLMPFGEYLPLSKTFPGIKKLSPQTGDFTVGHLKEPISFDVPGLSTPLKLSALICYEDLVPGLSREAVNEGGEVLVNLTNDAWYGNTAAPHQHHLLAAWRAIEARRYLVRSTNTGVTAVVDPLGVTFDRLPVFEEGYKVSEVSELSAKTVYSQIGDLPTFFVCLVVILVSFRRRLS